MASSLQTDFKSEPGILIVILNGRLDGNSAPAFGREIAEKLSSGTTSLLIDMTDLGFISSAGIREFLKLAKLQGQNKIMLAGIQPAVGEILDISGMRSLFRVAENQTEAKRQLAGADRSFLSRLFSKPSKA